MQKLKLSKIAILNDNGVLKPCVLSSRTIRNRRRVFNIKLENGSEYLYIPVDDRDSAKFIDSELSNKLSSSINSKLSLSKNGNIR